MPTYRGALPEIFPYVADITKRQADSFACVLLHEQGSFAVTCDNPKPDRVYFWMSETAKRVVETQALMLHAVEFHRTVQQEKFEIEIPPDFLVQQCIYCLTRHAAVQDCPRAESDNG